MTKIDCENKPDSTGLLSLLYKKYSGLFPHIKSVRGATRLNEKLQDLALRNEEKVRPKDNPITERKWKNLIILDACRYDAYERINGKTEKVISPGSCTKGYIRNTFSTRDWRDTVYISANTHFHKEIFKDLTGRNVEDVFYEVFHTYETDWIEGKGVLPVTMVREAITAEKLFPDKRKIIHFIQPHLPFLRYELSKNVNAVWDYAEAGKISHKEVCEGYLNNLSIVMPHVEDLVEKLHDETVITSDHGHFMGLENVYGHPPKRFERQVREVPWDKRNFD